LDTSLVSVYFIDKYIENTSKPQADCLRYLRYIVKVLLSQDVKVQSSG